jgi:hypothetical protein
MVIVWSGELVTSRLSQYWPFLPLLHTHVLLMH